MMSHREKHKVPPQVEQLRSKFNSSILEVSQADDVSKITKCGIVGQFILTHPLGGGGYGSWLPSPVQTWQATLLHCALNKISYSWPLGTNSSNLSIQPARGDGQLSNPPLYWRLRIEKRMRSLGWYLPLYTDRLLPLILFSALTSMGIMSVPCCQTNSTSALAAEVQ